MPDSPSSPSLLLFDFSNFSPVSTELLTSKTAPWRQEPPRAVARTRAEAAVGDASTRASTSKIAQAEVDSDSDLSDVPSSDQGAVTPLKRLPKAKGAREQDVRLSFDDGGSDSDLSDVPSHEEEDPTRPKNLSKAKKRLRDSENGGSSSDSDSDSNSDEDKDDPIQSDSDVGSDSDHSNSDSNLSEDGSVGPYRSLAGKNKTKAKASASVKEKASVPEVALDYEDKDDFEVRPAGRT